MMRREQGWALDGPVKDVWSREIGEHGHSSYASHGSIFSSMKAYVNSYVNTVTGSRQDSPPPDFRGGLLADQMGLGKSLSMISLIASNPASNLAAAAPTPFTSIEAHVTLRPVKATLLVVPLPREYSLFFYVVLPAKLCVSLTNLGYAVETVSGSF